MATTYRDATNSRCVRLVCWGRRYRQHGYHTGIQERFAAHLEAWRKRDEWARKGLKYSEAGNVKKAREALKHAERSDLQRRKLET